ncbi:sugar phosphate isomerase/epimerase [Microcella alkaliphila]|uniref:Sugar phosphate isomerase/epimerase n=2 Tax=Microcella alkaliphila TaxID=279828 RepID=A0A0U5BGM6_9MICO|nr:sugar phosphate isomerase/epimerase [Microcella alkaliphila]
MGYDLIEVCIEDPSLISADWIARQAERTQLRVSICGAFGFDRDASSPDQSRRDLATDYLRLCIDIAAEVGSPHVAGPMYAETGRTQLLPEAERAKQRLRAAETLRGVADYGAEKGVRLAIEPLNRFETDLINTLDQAAELCALIDRPNVGIMIDSFHMNIEEKKLGDAIRRHRELIFHVQASENDRGAPGSGHIDWEEFFSALHDIEYEGAVVVESFLPTVDSIARAVSLWRPVADSMDQLARDGLSFVTSQLALRKGRRT